MRFLLVERLPSRAVQIAEALSRFRAIALHATDVAQARTLVAREGRVDLVVLSELAQAGDAFGLVEWLRARCGDVPILFLGEDGHIEHAVRAIQGGARGYVVRRDGYLPRLAEEVARLLRESQAEAALTRSAFESEERRRLAAVLARHRWNVSAAARALGMSRGKLRSRLAALQMDR